MQRKSKKENLPPIAASLRVSDFSVTVVLTEHIGTRPPCNMARASTASCFFLGGDKLDKFTANVRLAVLHTPPPPAQRGATRTEVA